MLRLYNYFMVVGFRIFKDLGVVVDATSPGSVPV